jgi:prepilin-type N-terminal cleavage/methylation domain
MKSIKVSQKGFTLVEILVILPIMAIVIAAATAILINVVQSTSTSAHMFAVRQVQTAGYWVSKDGLQAQDIIDNNYDNPDTLHIEVNQDLDIEGTEILILQWSDRDGSAHRIVYSLADMPSGELKQLQRVEQIDGGAETVTVISQYIEYDASGTTPEERETSCDWANSNKESFIFTVTAKVAGARGIHTKTRTYEIKPRPFS